MSLFGTQSKPTSLFGSNNTSGGGLWGGGGSNTGVGFGSSSVGGGAWGQKASGGGGLFGSGGSTGGGGSAWGGGGGGAWGSGTTGGGGWGGSGGGGSAWGGGGGGGGGSSAWGAVGNAGRKGTRGVQYRPTRNPHDATGKTSLESITFMPEFEGKSHEELRYEDYAKGDKGGPTAGGGGAFGGSAFGTGSSGGALFGGSSAGGGAWGGGGGGNTGFGGSSGGGNMFSGGSTGGFGSSGTSGPSLFGGGASGFGSAPAGPSAFGAASGGGFGSSGGGFNANSAFGKPAAPSTFGGGAGGFGTSSGSAFGGGGFGPSSSAFGGAAPGFGSSGTAGFGASTASGFGSGPSGFGSSTPTPFGSKPATGFGSSGTGGFGSAFGAKPSPGFGGAGFGSTSGSSLFGGGGAAGGFGSSSGPSLFGGSKPSTGFGSTGTTTGSLFGGSSKPLFGSTGGALGGGGLFGGGSSGFGTGSGGLFGGQSSSGLFGQQSTAFGGQPNQYTQGPLITSLADNPFGSSNVINSMASLPSNSIQPSSTIQPTPGTQQSTAGNVSVIVGPRPHTSSLMPVRNYGPRRSTLFRSRRQSGRPFASPSISATDGGKVQPYRKSRAATIKKLVIDPKFKNFEASPIANGQGSATTTPTVAEADSSNQKLTLVLTRNGYHTRSGDAPASSSDNVVNLRSSRESANREVGESTQEVTMANGQNAKESNGVSASTRFLSPTQGLAREIFKSPIKSPVAYHMPGQGISPKTGKPKVYTDYEDYQKDQMQAMRTVHVDDPILTRDDYYTQPPMEELETFSSEELSAVSEFTVGRDGIGRVVFPGETDVRGLNLDEIIVLEPRSVVFYEGCERPPKGTGLNKYAIVTLEGIWSKKGGKPNKGAAATAKMVKKLKKHCVEQGLEFLGYDDSTGGWTFGIDGFDE